MEFFPFTVWQEQSHHATANVAELVLPYNSTNENEAGSFYFLFPIFGETSTWQKTGLSEI
jgi:anaerobic selenocysteine-containing dehydrogenase